MNLKDKTIGQIKLEIAIELLKSFCTIKHGQSYDDGSYQSQDIAENPMVVHEARASAACDQAEVICKEMQKRGWL